MAFLLHFLALFMLLCHLAVKLIWKEKRTKLIMFYGFLFRAILGLPLFFSSLPWVSLNSGKEGAGRLASERKEQTFLKVERKERII